jgi:hypothetical protein
LQSHAHNCTTEILIGDKGISAPAPFQELQIFTGNLLSKPNLDSGTQEARMGRRKMDRNKVEED